MSLGTWSYGGAKTVGNRAVGWAGHNDELAAQALQRAYDLGVRHWDTADAYGDGQAERLIGGLWNSVDRQQVFLASKVGWDPGSYGHFYHPDQIRNQLERSLQYLGTDHLDLYYLHHCDFGKQGEYLDPALEVIQEAQQAGKIRFIGLSDWSSKKVLRYAERVQPDVVQPYRNLLDDEYADSGLQAWVETAGAGVAFFSPLKHGLLLGKYTEPATFPEGDMRSGIAAFGDTEELARLRHCRREVEKRFGEHPQPVLWAVLGALLADAQGACVLLGMRNPEQASAAAEAGEALSAADAEWVRNLYQKKIVSD